MKLLRNTIMACLMGIGCVSCSSTTTPSATSSTIGAGRFVAASGETISADYRGNDTVILNFKDGTTRLLSRAVSGSGARYVSGPYEWWEHQGNATYSVSDKRVFIGKRQP